MSTTVSPTRPIRGIPENRPRLKVLTQSGIKPLAALAIAATAHLKLHPGLDVPRLQRKLGFVPDRQFSDRAPSSHARAAIAALESEGVLRIEPPNAVYPLPRAFLQQTPTEPRE